jgi:uncharacterized protein (TIGR04255 family)
VEQVQVATPDYVQAQSVQPDFSVVVDIDIFTPELYPITDAGSVLTWIDDAHNRLKENFFKLLPSKIIEELRVK